jgi:hypothetical protein
MSCQRCGGMLAVELVAAMYQDVSIGVRKGCDGESILSLQRCRKSGSSISAGREQRRSRSGVV